MIIYAWKYLHTSKLFQLSKIIDTAVSTIWVRRFYEAGEFELYIPASAEMLDFFTQSEEVMLTREDGTTAMIVEDVKLNTDAENGNYITISGRSSTALLERRIVNRQRTFTSTPAETVIRTLIDENVINPADAARTIALISLGTAKGYTPSINKQITGKTLLETISGICKEQIWGFDMPFTNGGFVFNLYQGLDRTYGQTSRPRVVFSPQWESLSSSEYEHDRRTHFNSVYVAGEGEGLDRKIVHLTATENPSPNGSLLLKEKWLDSRQTSSNGGEISSTTYNTLLMQQGFEFIKGNKDTQLFSGEVIASRYKYGTDYGLGDKVQVENEYGISGTAYVIEVTEVEDETGYNVYPRLSEWSV